MHHGERKELLEPCALLERKGRIFWNGYVERGTWLFQLYSYIYFLYRVFLFFTSEIFFILIHFRSRDPSHIWNGWNSFFFFFHPLLSPPQMCAKVENNSQSKRLRIRFFFFFLRFRLEREPSGNDFFLSLTGFRYF